MAEGRSDLAARLRKCGRDLVLRCCACTKDRHVKTRCDLKWCPTCQPALAARTGDRYARIAAGCEWPLMVTFTVEHSAADEVGLMREVRRSFTRLRRMRWFKSAQRGGVAAVEITHGKNGWHPHIHALMDARWFSVREPCPRIGSAKTTWRAAGRRAAQEIAEVWSLACGRPGTVEVHRVWTRGDGIAGAVREVLKYSAKGSDLAAVDQPIAPLIDELDRSRLVVSWGSFYRHPACKRQRSAPAMCGCGCSDWLPEDVLARTSRGEHGW